MVQIVTGNHLQYRAAYGVKKLRSDGDKGFDYKAPSSAVAGQPIQLNSREDSLVSISHVSRTWWRPARLTSSPGAAGRMHRGILGAAPVRECALPGRTPCDRGPQRSAKLSTCPFNAACLLAPACGCAIKRPRHIRLAARHTDAVPSGTAVHVRSEAVETVLSRLLFLAEAQAPVGHVLRALRPALPRGGAAGGGGGAGVPLSAGAVLRQASWPAERRAGGAHARPRPLAGATLNADPCCRQPR